MGWYKGSCAPLLALGVLVIVFWIGSYSRALNVHLPARAGGYAANVCVYRGLTSVTLVKNLPARRAGAIALSDGRDEVRALCWDAMLWKSSYAGLSVSEGMTWVRDEQGLGVSRQYQGFTLPMWFVLLSCAVMPLLQLRRVRVMNRRAALGQCRQCGYDLGGLGIDCPACVARTSLIGGSSGARALQPV